MFHENVSFIPHSWVTRIKSLKQVNKRFCGALYVLKGLCQAMRWNVSLHQLNSNNIMVQVVVKTIFRHWNCFLSSVACCGWQGCKDGWTLIVTWKHSATFFYVFWCYACKNHQKIVMISALWWKLIDIFVSQQGQGAS